MKSEHEIVAAHDALESLTRGEIPWPRQLGADERDMVYGMVSALCWVLGHETGSAFQHNLELIRDLLLAEGYKLERVQ
jgi:hypothetical protein